MAHEVQAGSSRVKVRSLWGVFLLGWITGGIACLVYWAKMVGELARFEESERGETGVNVKAESIVPVLGFALGSWLNYFPPGAETTIDPVTGLPVESSGGAVVGFALFGLYILWLYMAFRMRSHITRVMTHVGMLPEDRPSAVPYWLCCLFGPVIGTTAVASNLNKAWEQFPRYYASIGGTKEDVAARAAGAGVAAAVPAAQPATGAAPAATHAAPVAAVAIPASLAAAPSASAETAAPAAATSPQERMQQLAAGAAAGTLTSDESLAYAEAVEQVHGGEHAAPWYRYLAMHDPSCRKAAWWHGVYLLDRGDAGGIELLHRVMGDPTYDQWARDKVATFLEAQGRPDEAARYRSAA